MITERNSDDSLRYEDSTGQIRMIKGAVVGSSQTVLTSVPAGGTGTTAGGWDTAGNRNTSITTFTEIKTQLNAWISALTTAGYTSVAQVGGSFPAGGTGAAAGGWDTAANRDLAIAAARDLITQLNTAMAQYRIKGYPVVANVAGTVVDGGTGAAGGCYDTAGNRNTAITTLGEIKTQLNLLIADQRNRGYLTNAS